MADYWRSGARKYCKYCDCWYADNKISVQHHENGNRHKGNVQRKLEQFRKESAEMDESAAATRTILASMEKSAYCRYKTDLKNGSVSGYGAQVKEQQQTNERVQDGEEQMQQRQPCLLQWIQSETLTGKQYYHNPATRQVIWKKKKANSSNGFSSCRPGNHESEGLGLPSESALNKDFDEWDPDKDDLETINAVLDEEKEIVECSRKVEGKVEFKKATKRPKNVRKSDGTGQ